MCEHCGCRGVEPIAQLMDEHLELLDLGGEIRRLLRAGKRFEAVRALGELERRLSSHVRREEAGLFAALKADGDFAGAVLELEVEHTAFDAAFAALDLEAVNLAQRVDEMLDELSLHIDKENLGIFPVAVVSLGASGWEIVGRAERAAEPTTSPQAGR